MKYLLLAVLLLVSTAAKGQMVLTDAEVAELVSAELTKRPESAKRYVKGMILLYPNSKQVILDTALSIKGINPLDVVPNAKGKALDGIVPLHNRDAASPN